MDAILSSRAHYLSIRMPSRLQKQVDKHYYLFKRLHGLEVRLSKAMRRLGNLGMADEGYPQFEKRYLVKLDQTQLKRLMVFLNTPQSVGRKLRPPEVVYRFK